MAQGLLPHRVMRVHALLGLVLASCTGTIDAPGTTIDGLCGDTSPGPSPIRRMTRAEYDRTLRDLLGDTTRPARAFAPEEEALGFPNNAATLVTTPLLAEQYMVAAEAISARAKIDTLLACDPDRDDTCVRAFVTRFGQRAFRRPLEGAETSRLVEVYRKGREANDAQSATRLVLQAMLQSPHFLYRVEVNAPGTQVSRVGGYEMASRLSYFLWGTMPDDELFRAAQAGALGTAQEVAAQARRMLEDEKAKEAVSEFHRHWLLLDQVSGLEKDTSVYPEFTPDLRPLLLAETEAFVLDVLFAGPGDVKTLLTAPYTFLNAQLATLYGIKNGPSGEALVRVDSDPTQRAGLFTQGSLLMVNAKPNQASPIHRGKFVREKLLCQTLPPPPDDVEIVIPALDPNLTTRERFKQHSENEFCSGCHVLMDPIGFGFENYDGLGRFRTEENGRPVDAKGEIVASSDLDGTFEGAVELAHKLAGSAQVHECVATQWFRFAYGRGETRADECTMRQIHQAFAASGYNVRELLVALTQTDAFLYRSTAQGETL